MKEIQRLESVIYITQMFFQDWEETQLGVSHVEIYPLGKAYGGPIVCWDLATDKAYEQIEGLNVYGGNKARALKARQLEPLGMDDVVLVELAIRETFAITLTRCGCDPRRLDKVTAYKKFSDLEFERLFIWERGKPITPKGYYW